ncbi:MFS transporter [Kitasatospora sp. NPDC048540]|uniref:MFS transporter n=1 Tax=unclassified Kitasatospora TaxID=2633591 RepID=UPI0007C79040|nr:MFS transporter [Kitasatospora sp. MBT63]
MGLSILVLAVLLLGVDATVLSLALPSIGHDLNPSGAQILWIGDIYSFVLAGLLITMGSLGDRIGRKRLLIIGSICFGLASLLAAFAPTAGWLIVARALLGLAGATLMPSTLSLIRALFPDARERATAIGIWSAAATAGAAVGPLVGGLLLEHFWWGSVFLINVPITVLLVIGGRRLLPESKDPSPGAWDVPSVLLSMVGLLGVVYAVKEAAAHGVLRSDVAVAGAVGTAALFVFVRRQLRLPVPLMDIRLFKSVRFSAAVSATLLSLLGLSGVIFFMSQYLQLVRGYSPVQAGLAELPAFAGAVAAGLLIGRVIRRRGMRAVLCGGLLLMGLGTGVLGWVSADTDYLLLAVVFLIVGVTEGAIYTVSTDLVLSSSPPDKAGAAAAISETAYELGAALGIALVGSALLAVFRGSLQLPPGVDGHSADLAGESLAGALDVAAGLPTATADALAAQARTAFQHGLNAAALMSGALLVLAALGTWWALRRSCAKHGTDTPPALTSPVRLDPPADGVPSNRPDAPAAGARSNAVRSVDEPPVRSTA